MNRFVSQIDNSVFDAIKSGIMVAKFIAHPSRSSMGQVLSGKGALAFEGELLETPLAWHPKGTRH